MGGQIISCVIIGYLLFLFPTLMGSLLIREKEKEIGICYLYGMVVSFALFFLEAYVCDYFDLSLSRLASAYAITAAVITICALIVLLGQRRGLRLSVKYLAHNMTAGILTAVFVVFRRDTATDSVLENALTHFAADKITGLSPYTGEAYTEAVHTGFVPAFYAALSKLSGLHVTVIAKFLVPFAVVFAALAAYRILICRFCDNDGKKTSQGLWIVLFLWLFLCFENFPGYRMLWEASWTPECLIWACFLPVLLWLFAAKKWEPRLSLLFIAIIADIGFAADAGMVQNLSRILPGLLIVLIILFLGISMKRPLARLRERIGKTAGSKRLFKTALSLFAVTFAGISIVWNGCIVTDSTYALPGNRYKMEPEVMQIHMMSENQEYVKMLAPPEVTAQIREKDLKVNLLVGADMANEPDAPELMRLKEIAADLEVNEYEPIKLIQHGMAEGCNLIVAYRDERTKGAQEELFRTYGYRKIGETEHYTVYERQD